MTSLPLWPVGAECLKVSAHTVESQQVAALCDLVLNYQLKVKLLQGQFQFFTEMFDECCNFHTGMNATDKIRGS